MEATTIFWIVALVLAALAAALLLRALRHGPGAAPAAAYDLRVYRDQLAEIERDLARGTLPAEDAERARLEISRRVLASDQAAAAADAAADAAAGAAGRAPKTATRAMAGIATLVVVAGSAWLYSRIGAPGYPDQPLKARIEMSEAARAARPAQAEAEAALGAPPPRAAADPAYVQLVERLRTVVAERPGDVQGLALLARNEAILGNYADAYAAQTQLIAAKGDAATAEDHADLAEMLILATRGYVSPEAEAALTQALTRDPRNASARYYSGLLFAQIGRPDLAFRFWNALLSESPPDAPWVAPIRGQIEEIAFRAGQNNYQLPPLPAAPETAQPGPTAGDIEAAAALSPEEREQMIRNMVAGLAGRLATEGGPASDWARLIRAYGVLGEAETARPILVEARRVFAADPASLAEIEAAAGDAGLAP